MSFPVRCGTCCGEYLASRDGECLEAGVGDAKAMMLTNLVLFSPETSSVQAKQNGCC